MLRPLVCYVLDFVLLEYQIYIMVLNFAFFLAFTFKFDLIMSFLHKYFGDFNLLIFILFWFLAIISSLTIAFSEFSFFLNWWDNYCYFKLIFP